MAVQIDDLGAVFTRKIEDLGVKESIHKKRPQSIESGVNTTHA